MERGFKVKIVLPKVKFQEVLENKKLEPIIIKKITKQ